LCRPSLEHVTATRVNWTRVNWTLSNITPPTMECSSVSSTVSSDNCKQPRLDAADGRGMLPGRPCLAEHEQLLGRSTPCCRRQLATPVHHPGPALLSPARRAASERRRPPPAASSSAALGLWAPAAGQPPCVRHHMMRPLLTSTFLCLRPYSWYTIDWRLTTSSSDDARCHNCCSLALSLSCAACRKPSLDRRRMYLWRA
jgi:hypothetical protein